MTTTTRTHLSFWPQRITRNLGELVFVEMGSDSARSVDDDEMMKFENFHLQVTRTRLAFKVPSGQIELTLKSIIESRWMNKTVELELLDIIEIVHWCPLNHVSDTMKGKT